MSDKEENRETLIKPHTVTITRAANGFIVKDSHDDIPCGVVIEEEERIDDNKTETEAMIKLLYLIKEAFGAFGDKHDDHRVYVLDLPGHDSDTFTDKMSDVIWYREDQEREKEEREKCQCGTKKGKDGPKE